MPTHFDGRYSFTTEFCFSSYTYDVIYAKEASILIAVTIKITLFSRNFNVLGKSGAKDSGIHCVILVVFRVISDKTFLIIAKISQYSVEWQHSAY